jgi:hypothetical protein
MEETTRILELTATNALLFVGIIVPLFFIALKINDGIRAKKKYKEEQLSVLKDVRDGICKGYKNDR